jgi:hypothetical protein
VHSDAHIRVQDQKLKARHQLQMALVGAEDEARHAWTAAATCKAGSPACAGDELGLTAAQRPALAATTTWPLPKAPLKQLQQLALAFSYTISSHTT